MVNQYCAHSFARKLQLPFLNQWKGANDCRKYLSIVVGGQITLVKDLRNLPTSNPKTDCDNDNAHTKFIENPLIFTQLIIWKQKY